MGGISITSGVKVFQINNTVYVVKSLRETQLR